MAKDLWKRWKKVLVRVALDHRSDIVSDTTLQFTGSAWASHIGVCSTDDLGRLLSYFDFLQRVSDKMFEKLKNSNGLQAGCSILEYRNDYLYYDNEEPSPLLPAVTVAKASGRSKEKSDSTRRNRFGRSGSPDRSRRPSCSPSRSQSSGRCSQFFCNYCRKKGHTSSRCWHRFVSLTVLFLPQIKITQLAGVQSPTNPFRDSGECKRAASPNPP